ncbi:hypothetical protein BC936DRAFT_143037 [Jimgerdemannia flammicorona]|uniref:DUF2306 domain-containing protein n=1 Tax=Jimgerdemannia flammicorona TaxID=994334 RepID=A0A432ZZQ3_9FUNG|nr:hypothetical protein BC936DRAFT_143037 [Jimgerdemannia flammicorona]
MYFIPVYLWAIAMPLQLSTTIRKSAPSWHRKIGTITLGISGLLISISGVFFHVAGIAYQTHDPVGSLAWIFSNRNTTTVLAAWFLYVTIKGYLAARAKRFDQHRRWMVRYAAAGYSVVVQRIIFIIVALVYGFNTEAEERFKRNLFGYLLSIGVALSVVVAELGLWVHSRPAKKSVKSL